jgi:polyphosphate glucokinase
MRIPENKADETPVSADVIAQAGIVAHTSPKQPSGEKHRLKSNILAIDIGGTKVKMLATGQLEPVKAPTGPRFKPVNLVDLVQKQYATREYRAITIGFPGLVGPRGPKSEPGNLGSGWVGFDFASAFGVPVKIVNDAVMQALGSYDKGRMLFLGLGTGIGSALIAEHLILPLELGNLRYDLNQTLSDVLGANGMERLGKRRWRKAVNEAVEILMRTFMVDYIVIGGGNSKNIKELPVGTRRGHNIAALSGGLALWETEDEWVIAGATNHPRKRSEAYVNGQSVFN